MTVFLTLLVLNTLAVFSQNVDVSFLMYIAQILLNFQNLALQLGSKRLQITILMPLL
jgi:hypothetical protein